MGLDTAHLKLTVKQHLERSLFILKDPQQFFSTLFSGEITLKEQVIPYFVLFSLLNVTVRALFAVITDETILFALHISIVQAVQQGLIFFALSYLLAHPKVEEHTGLHASKEKYAALLVYTATAGYYASLASNILFIFVLLGLYSLYLIFCGMQPLAASGKQVTGKTYLVVLAAAAVCGLAVMIITRPFVPTYSSPYLRANLSDEERLQEKIKEILDFQQNKNR